MLGWLRRWWGVAALGVAALLGLYVGLAPAVARWAAVRTLEGIGLTGVQFDVEGVSPSHTELRNVTVGDEGRVRVAAAGVSYTPSGLARGRVTALDLAGAEVELKLRGGVLDIGPLAGLLSGPMATRQMRLPFARADLRSSVLVLDWEGRRLRIAVQGSIEDAGDGQAKLQARLELAGATIRLAAAGDLNTLVGELTVEGQTADFAGLLAAVPPKVAALPGHAGGPLAFRVTVSSRKDGIEAALTAKVEGAAFATRIAGRGLGLVVDRVSAEAQARLNRSLALLALTSHVRAANLRVNGEAIETVLLDAECQRGAWGVAASASGEGWEAGAKLLEWPGPRGRPGASPEATVPVSLHAEGRLPPGIRMTLRAHGIDAEGLGRIAIEGAALGRFRRSEQGWLWGVEAPDLKATLEPGDVAIGPAGLALRRLAGEARIKARVDPKGLRLDVLPGARVMVGGAEAWWPDLFFGLDDAKEPAAELAVGERPATVAVAFGSGGPAWECRAPDVRVAIQRGRLALPGPGLAADGLSGSATLDVSATPAALTVRVGPKARVGVGWLAIRDAGAQPLKATTAEPLLAAEVGAKQAEATIRLDGGKPRWHVEAPEIRLGLRECALSIADGAVKVEGLKGALLLRVAGGPDAVAVTPLGDGELAFRALDTRPNGLAASLGPSRFAVRSHGGAPLLSLGATERGWGVRAGADLASSGAIEVASRVGAAAKLGSLKGRVATGYSAAEGASFSGQLLADEVACTLSFPVSGGLLAASSSGGLLSFSFSGLSKPGQGGREPLDLRLTAKAGPAQWRAELSSGELVGSLGKIEANGLGRLDREGRLELDGRLSFGEASVRHAILGVAASGISAEVPVTLHREAKEAGRFEVASVAFGTEKLATLGKLGGTARLADGKLELNVDWPLAKRATLSGEGWLDLARGVVRGEAKAQVPPFEVAEDNQPGTLYAPWRGLDVRGRFSLDASFSLAGDRLDPRVRLEVRKGQLTSREYHAAAEGVDGAVEITSFDPLSTPGAQLVKAERAHLGDLKVSDGFVAFRVERTDKIFIERTSWGWLGGRLYTYAVRVNPFAPSIGMDVYGNYLDLKEFLALVPDARATGEGKLYGRLPIKFRQTAQGPRMTFGDGFLYAMPGKGVLRVGGAKSVGQLLESQDPRFAREPSYVGVKDRLVTALQDFEYSVLKADFIVEGNDLVARVHVEGQGRTGERPQRIDGFNLNIHHFDWYLNTALFKSRF